MYAYSILFVKRFHVVMRCMLTAEVPCCYVMYAYSKPYAAPTTVACAAKLSA